MYISRAFGKLYNVHNAQIGKMTDVFPVKFAHAAATGSPSFITKQNLALPIVQIPESNPVTKL
jgi:hypothetical protein